MINSSLLYEDIEKYYLENNSYPHCLIQLSNKEYKDLQKNSIHVKGINFTDKKMQYSEIACVGSNIQLKEKVINIDGSDTIVNIVNVTRLKNRVMCITTTVSEVLSVKSDTIIIPSTSSYDNSMNEVSKADDD